MEKTIQRKLQHERKKEERNKEKQTGRSKQGNSVLNGYERQKEGGNRKEEERAHENVCQSHLYIH